ncbi:AsmA family protein [Deefgea piscis]|uniref:AsmA family protein n=1 Tax=Deefgea piscis TaxID=2739061 RepID=UPI001C8029B1|nr:AsmA family protein [Deefgea piscis]QZA80888.1 AsmA family protein [Deefgea piscis]
MTTSPKKILIGSTLFLGFAASLPLIVPYGAFKNSLETKLSQMNGGKTQIAHIEFSYQPTPVFILRDVVIERPETAQIAEIIIPVTSYNLLNWGKSMRNVLIRNAVLSRAFALDLPNRIKTDDHNGFRVDRLALEKVSIKLDRRTIGPIDGELRFRPNGNIEDLVIRTDQDRAEIQVQPTEPGQFKVQFNASNWELPLGQPVKFDFLKLIGTADANGWTISDIRADLYGGLVTGSAQLNWQSDWQLTGHIFAKNISVEPLMSLYSPITRSTGRMNADASFKYQGATEQQLFKQAQIQGRFIIQDGTLHNFDLITPLKSQTPTTLRRGGQTNFSSLSGSIAINDKSVSLYNLILQSGKFRANGELRVSQQKISGSIGTQLAAGAMMANNQLSISGQLAAPELNSRGTLRPNHEERSPSAETEAPKPEN